MSSLEPELDRLYGLPLDEFTAARNELARNLKRDGDEAGSAAVRGLGKPSVPAWVVNQLVRREPEGIRALLRAGEAVVAAQAELLGGKGDAEALRAATSSQRDAVSKLLHSARAILSESGRPSTPATVERIARTLQAAAVEEEGRRLLESGRLTTELEPAGFDAFAGIPVEPRRKRAGARDELAVRRRARDERQRRRRELQAEVRELERAAAKAERDAGRAAAAAAEARRAADAARAKADRAATELAELE